jgi:hypothetical protein
MMIKGKTAAIFFAAVFAAQAAPTAVSFARGRSDGPTTSTNLRAKLVSAPGAPVECEGEARYAKKVNSLRSTSAESFSGKVECPADDPATAQTDVYDMHLARGGVDYAVCTLVIKELDFEYKSDPLVADGIDADYAVNVGQKSPPTPPLPSAKVGGCTVPDSIAPVVPAVQAGDTATVFLHPDAVTPVLTGTFVIGSGD